MTSIDIFNHLGRKGLFTPDYVYRVFLGLQLCIDGTLLRTLIEKGTRVNARSRKPRLSTVLAERNFGSGRATDTREADEVNDIVAMGRWLKIKIMMYSKCIPTATTL